MKKQKIYFILLVVFMIIALTIGYICVNNNIITTLSTKTQEEKTESGEDVIQAYEYSAASKNFRITSDAHCFSQLTLGNIDNDNIISYHDVDMIKESFSSIGNPLYSTWKDMNQDGVINQKDVDKLVEYIEINYINKIEYNNPDPLKHNRNDLTVVGGTYTAKQIKFTSSNPSIALIDDEESMYGNCQFEIKGTGKFTITAEDTVSGIKDTFYAEAYDAVSINKQGSFYAAPQVSSPDSEILGDMDKDTYLTNNDWKMLNDNLSTTTAKYADVNKDGKIDSNDPNKIVEKFKAYSNKIEVGRKIYMGPNGFTYGVVQAASSNPNIARVDEDGNLEVLSTGQFIIYITDGRGYSDFYAEAVAKGTVLSPTINKIDVTSTTDKSDINITATPNPKDSGIYRYQVIQYQVTADGNKKLKDEYFYTPNYSITGLKPNSKYHIVVAAQGDNGETSVEEKDITTKPSKTTVSSIFGTGTDPIAGKTITGDSVTLFATESSSNITPAAGEALFSDLKYEYSLDNGKTWQSMPLADKSKTYTDAAGQTKNNMLRVGVLELKGLKAGTYSVITRATGDGGTGEVSSAYTFTIGSTVTPPTGDITIKTNGDGYTVDNTNKQIWIPVNTTEDELFKHLSIENAYNKVVSKNETGVESSYVGTGGTITVYKDASDKTGVTYTFLAATDVTGDGLMNTADVMAIRMHIVESKLLTGVYLKVADVNKNSEVDVTDAIKVRQEISNMEKK